MCVCVCAFGWGRGGRGEEIGLGVCKMRYTCMSARRIHSYGMVWFLRAQWRIGLWFKTLFVFCFSVVYVCEKLVIMPVGDFGPLFGRGKGIQVILERCFVVILTCFYSVGSEFLTMALVQSSDSEYSS